MLSLLRVQVTDLQPSKGGKYSCKLGDGCQTLEAVATKQVSQIIARGDIKNEQIVRITNHTLNEVAGKRKLIWLDCEVRPCSLSFETSFETDICHFVVLICIAKINSLELATKWFACIQKSAFLLQTVLVLIQHSVVPLSFDGK